MPVGAGRCLGDAEGGRLRQSKAKSKFVLGENISETASFIGSGSADVGIVALALALSPNMKDKELYREIPIIGMSTRQSNRPV